MQKHPILSEYEDLLKQTTISNEEFIDKQTAIFKNAIAALKTDPHVDLDYVIGNIGIFENDRYNMPFKNVLGHLNRAYKNGHDTAGLVLSNLLKGGFSHIPEEYHDKKKSLNILEELAARGNPKANTNLGYYYLDEILNNHANGSYAAEEWYDACLLNANEAAKANYIGGHVLLGYIYFNGFGLLVENDNKKAFYHYQKASEMYDGDIDDMGYFSDAKCSLGTMYFDGLGVLRDRRKGLDLMQEAADMGSLVAQDWLKQNQDFLRKEGFANESSESIYDASIDDFDEIVPTHLGAKGKFTH